MKITIISGSHRQNSQSTKISKVINSALELLPQCDEQYLFDLANVPMPLWDEGIWNGDNKWETLLGPISEQLASSDAFVIISPEWHGMVPALSLIHI